MKVAISYSHSTESHKNKVLRFAERLQENNIEYIMDYYELDLADDMCYFMEQLTLNNEYVLVICDQLYKDKADRNEGGVGFEAKYLRARLFKDPKAKIIPVIFEHDSKDKAIVPNFLLPENYIDLTDDIDFTSKNFDILTNMLKGKKDESVDSIFSHGNCTNNCLPLLNNICYPRKATLSERSKKVIHNIAEYFNKNASEVKPILLKSWSGEGKTTIASEFSYMYGSQFCGVVWIDLSKEIKTQYIELYEKMDVRIPQELSSIDKEREYKFNYIKNYFNKNQVLIVFDNVGDINDIRLFMPNFGKSRIIIITTNFKIANDEQFNNIEIPPLTESESLQILLQGYNISSPKDIEAAKEMTQLLGNLPFALELANSYLKDYDDVDLNILHERLKLCSINSDEFNDINRYGFIHSAPSIYFLLKGQFDRISTLTEKGKLAFETMLIIACLDISGDEYNYRDIVAILKLDEKTPENALQFSKIKKNLLTLGLATSAESKFVVHKLTIEYAKLYLIDKEMIQRVIQYKLSETQKSIQWMLILGWIDCIAYLNSILKLINYSKEKFPPANSNDTNILIENLMNLNKAFYFCSKDDDCIKLLDMALNLAKLDSDFEHAEIRQNDILLKKAISLHRLKKYDQAMSIYLQFNDRSLASSPIDTIDLNIYMGHIYQFNNDIIRAEKSYEFALLNCVEYYHRGYLSIEEYKEQKTRILMYVLRFYINNSITNNTEEHAEDLDDWSREAIKTFSNNTKINSDEYPFIIWQQLMDRNGLEPLAIKLTVRLISDPV